ncbi:helix-turn-helix domain-containing protein [Nocardia miyunensis]|uniref:AraC-like ligand-binding domain-containing protein n=1 Tax=Nocardia miyunensis TaxID=282684 RepID=UPI0008310DB4|nr:helix-turn-helix domain-containing protein [Nocardia miyunensis]
MNSADLAPIRHDCGLDRDDALLAWRVGVEDFFPPLRIDPLDGRFAGSIIGARTAELQVTDIAGTSHQVSRRPGGHRASGEFFKLTLQLAGSGVVRQGGNETRLEPGTIVIYDFARSYDLVFETDTRFLVALFPKDALGLPDGVVGELTAAPLASAAGTAPLVASYLRGLADNLGVLAGPSGARVSRHFLDLVGTFLGEHLERRVGPARAEVGALTMRILRYVDEQLGDPELDAARIAEVHHVSVRYLHKLFEPTGSSVGQWIRRRRLECARTQLAARGGADLAVAEIAHRCGFVDAGYFGRVFKNAYGVTPGQWRDDRALSSHIRAR